jgi:hypothetical protein
MVVSFIDKEKERQKPVKEHRKLNMNLLIDPTYSPLIYKNIEI